MTYAIRQEQRLLVSLVSFLDLPLIISSLSRVLFIIAIFLISQLAAKSLSLFPESSNNLFFVIYMRTICS